VSRHHVGCPRQLVGGECLALCGDDLGSLFALGLGLASHRALHIVGQLDVSELDDRDLDPPLFCLHVEDLADVLIDAFGLGQQLVERVTTHHRAEGGLGDLADRGLDVLDCDHRTDRILHAVIGHRGHVDADVIPGDDPL
jgi:hypothetical protein